MNFQELDLSLPREAITLAETAREFGQTVMRPAGIALDRLKRKTNKERKP